MATSKLQNKVGDYLSIHFRGCTIRENVRPDWLITPEGERLELDFLIEELGIAIEVQGNHHYVFTPHFHTDYEGFRARLRRDEFKRETCGSRGIQLVEIANEDEIAGIALKVTPRETPQRKQRNPKEIYSIIMSTRKLGNRARGVCRRIRRFTIEADNLKRAGAPTDEIRIIKRRLKTLEEEYSAIALKMHGIAGRQGDKEFFMDKPND